MTIALKFFLLLAASLALVCGAADALQLAMVSP
jgi:hypothetical protein